MRNKVLFGFLILFCIGGLVKQNLTYKRKIQENEEYINNLEDELVDLRLELYYK